jgi:SAM-dependent methyltransferase
MNPDAMRPYGQALLDFFSGDAGAALIVEREDGLRSDLPVRTFFRQEADFSPFDQAALALCQGPVLDVGAGAGRHSLVLQERGYAVLAVDVSPAAVEIMRGRGVEDALCAYIFAFQGGPFDTLLLMMHGLGMVETLSGLDRLLDHARTLVSPHGQILLDSLDVRETTDPTHIAYQEAVRQAGRYVGEIRMRFEYRGQTGPTFGWLHVDPETLGRHARRTEWGCRVVRRETNGDYLAQLERT